MKEFEPVFFRGDPEMLPELSGKESGTAETAALGDLLDREPGQCEHSADLFQTGPYDILRHGGLQVGSEHPAQGPDADPAGGRDPLP